MMWAVYPVIVAVIELLNMIIPPTIAGVKVVPLPVTVVPVCDAVPVEFDDRVNIHVAPPSIASPRLGPPTAKVFPSAERDTE